MGPAGKAPRTTCGTWPLGELERSTAQKAAGTPDPAGAGTLSRIPLQLSAGLCCVLPKETALRIISESSAKTTLPLSCLCQMENLRWSFRMCPQASPRGMAIVLSTLQWGQAESLGRTSAGLPQASMERPPQGS